MISALILATLVAQTQPSAAPTGAPSPAASATPSAIGPALTPNDPCTTMSAIVTRPTVTNGVCTVRPNHVEIEAGYQNTSFEAAGNVVTYPQTLIRVGTTVPELELQIVPPQAVRSSAGGVLTGQSDAGVALRYLVGSSPRMAYAVQLGATAPTGTAGFSAGATQTFYSAQATYGFSPVLSAFFGVQDQILSAGGATFGSFVPSLGFSLTLPSSSAVFGEVAQFTHAIGPGTPTRTQYVVGASHDVGQRLQLDVEYGFSPTVATGKYRYVGAGASYYF